MHGGVRRTDCDGSPSAAARDAGRAHGALQADGGTRPHEALEQHDKLAREIIDRALTALGAGIASAINLLDVEAIVIGGGLGVRFGQPFTDRIADAMYPHLFNDTRPPAMHAAALGDLGGAIGAALLVRGSVR
jgi:predicted NBD/HSP70 family sugar kinase